MLGAASASFLRFRFGAFEITALMAGTRMAENPQEIFGTNVSAEKFAQVPEANFLPTDAAQFFFTPTLVNTGAELVLFDTALAPEGTVGALAAAGYAPDQVDAVVLTHMHPDQIGGLGPAGATFPNARFVTGQAEFDHWAGQVNEGGDANVRPLAEKTASLSARAARWRPGSPGWRLSGTRRGT
jgi:glyoxylase-like metal-dependent hydrolase (beta-lactamase superfamily II)